MFDDRMSAPIDFRKRYRQYVHIYVYILPLSSRSSPHVVALFVSFRMPYYQLSIGNAFVPKRTYLFEPQRNIVFIGDARASSSIHEFKGCELNFNRARVCIRIRANPVMVRWKFWYFFFLYHEYREIWIGFPFLFCGLDRSGIGGYCRIGKLRDIYRTRQVV